MANSALGIKNLDIDSKEFTSADLFDSFDDENQTDPKKKKKAIPPAPEEEKEENDDEFIPPTQSTLSSLFGDDEEQSADEEEDLPTPEKEEEKKEEEKEEETEDDDNGNQYNILAKELVNMGIFAPEDDEDELTFDNGQEFAERWKYEFQKASRTDLNNYLQSKGREAVEWFDAVYNKGVSPKEYMQQWDSVEGLSNLNMEDEYNQERVVKELLKQQGFEPEDITAQITKLKNIGELEDYSQRYHKVLVKREASKLEDLKKQSLENETRKKAERENYRVTLTQLLNTKMKTKEFDGIPVNQAVASEVFDSLYNYKYTRPEGGYQTQFDKDIENLNNNPEMKLKVGLLLNILKKDPSMSALKKKAVSKENNELFKDLAHKKKTLIRKQTPIESFDEFGA